MTNEVPTKHTTLIEALAAAQGQFPAVLKDRKATVKSDKGSYSYSYANLADVLAAVRPVLSAHQIAVIQHIEPNGSGLLLRTALRGYGEALESLMPVTTGPTAPQALGSALSYYRRYALMALVGVAAEEDDDDGAEAGRHPPPRPTSRDQSRPPLDRMTKASLDTLDEIGRELDAAERKPRLPPDDAWLEAAKLKVANSEPDELRTWWNSEAQKRQRQDLHKRRADLAPAMEELKDHVAERWWECSSLEIPPNGMGWQRWQGLMARTIDAAPTVAKLDQLLRDNYAHTQALAEAVPRAAEALAAKIENARTLLDDNEAPIDLGEDEDGRTSSG